jgi:hypothetical protein
MIHYWGNVVEAVFWMAVATGVYFRSEHKLGDARLGTGETAAVAFFWFGVSDLVETTTGAWYHPLALLVWKAACVVALLHCLHRHRQSSRHPPAIEGRT